MSMHIPLTKTKTKTKTNPNAKTNTKMMNMKMIYFIFFVLFFTTGFVFGQDQNQDQDLQGQEQGQNCSEKTSYYTLEDDYGNSESFFDKFEFFTVSFFFFFFLGEVHEISYEVLRVGLGLGKGMYDRIWLSLHPIIPYLTLTLTLP